MRQWTKNSTSIITEKGVWLSRPMEGDVFKAMLKRLHSMHTRPIFVLTTHFEKHFQTLLFSV